MYGKGSGGATGFTGSAGPASTGAVGRGGGGATDQEGTANSEPAALGSTTRCASASSVRATGTVAAVVPACALRTAGAAPVRAGATGSASLGPNITYAATAAAMPVSHLPRVVRFTGLLRCVRIPQNRYPHSPPDRRPLCAPGAVCRARPRAPRSTCD